LKDEEKFLVKRFESRLKKLFNELLFKEFIVDYVFCCNFYFGWIDDLAKSDYIDSKELGFAILLK